MESKLNSERIYNAIVLVDEPGNHLRHFATMVEKQVKTIETRMKDIIPPNTNIVICCGSKSMTANRLKALCIVQAAPGRPMTKEDELAACIDCIPGRVAYELSNWRYFSRKFEFARYKISGTFQGIFQIRIPDVIEILDSQK